MGAEPVQSTMPPMTTGQRMTRGFTPRPAKTVDLARARRPRHERLAPGDPGAVGGHHPDVRRHLADERPKAPTDTISYSEPTGGRHGRRVLVVVAPTEGDQHEDAGASTMASMMRAPTRRKGSHVSARSRGRAVAGPGRRLAHRPARSSPRNSFVRADVELEVHVLQRPGDHHAVVATGGLDRHVLVPDVLEHGLRIVGERVAPPPAAAER